MYASPFLRTVETAAEVCAEIGATVALEPGLGEHHNPEWFDAAPETLSVAALAERFDAVRTDHDPLVAPTFPEDGATAAARVTRTARELAARTTGDLLLVGHGLTVGGVAAGLVGSDEGVSTPLCGVTRVDRVDGGWRLAFSGDTSHL